MMYSNSGLTSVQRVHAVSLIMHRHCDWDVGGGAPQARWLIQCNCLGTEILCTAVPGGRAACPSRRRLW